MLANKFSVFAGGGEATKERALHKKQQQQDKIRNKELTSMARAIIGVAFIQLTIRYTVIIMA